MSEPMTKREIIKLIEDRRDIKVESMNKTDPLSNANLIYEEIVRELEHIITCIKVREEEDKE